MLDRQKNEILCNTFMSLPWCLAIWLNMIMLQDMWHSLEFWTNVICIFMFAVWLCWYCIH